MKHMILLGSTTAPSVLDETMKAAIKSGFEALSATVSDVLVLAVPVAVSVIALTAGINYALKKVKGVISMAA